LLFKSAAWILKSAMPPFFKSAMWFSNQRGRFENPSLRFPIRHETSLQICHVAFQICQVASQISHAAFQISHVDLKTGHADFQIYYNSYISKFFP
jgi:hypothetical protein